MFAANQALDIRTVVEYRGLREFLEITSELEYQRLVNVIPMDAETKILRSRLNGAIIKDYGEFGGRGHYEEPQFFDVPISVSYQKGGLQMREAYFEDNGIYGKLGVSAAAEWSEDVMVAAAYWPQRQSIALLRSGHSTTFLTGPTYGKPIGNSYDGVPLFSRSHPYNWQATGLGYFSNIFYGGSLVDGRGVDVASQGSGSITAPGFCPLAGPFGTAGAQVTPAAALDNLYKVIAYVMSIKMPDGVTPRFLKPTTIVCGPKLKENVDIITNAQFIAAQAGASSSGSMELRAVMTKLGLKAPLYFSELSGNTDIDADEDYDWYLHCEDQAARSRYGSVIFGPRKPFRLQMFAPTSGSEGVNLELAEQNLIKWINEGRSGVAVGLPQFIFKNTYGSHA